MFNKILRQRKAKLEEQINLIEKLIQERNQYLANINSQVEQQNQSLSQIQNKLIESERKLNECRKELGIAEGIITMQELDMAYEPTFDDLDVIAFKKARTQESIAKLLGDNLAIITTRVYRIDGSESKGRQFQKTFCENLLIGFNTYYNSKKKASTSSNIAKTEELIKNKFQAINKKSSLMGVSINQKYLDLCIELLYLELDEKIAKAKEKRKNQRRVPQAKRTRKVVS